MKLYDVIQKEYPTKSQVGDIISHQENTRQHEPLSKHPKHSKKKKILFFAITALFVVAIYIVGIKYTRARVIIEERVIPFTLDNTIIELPHETESDSKRLSFQTMKVTTEITREIFGSELKEVTGKAQGSVIFFNEYSTTAQTIKMGTKIVGANNKNYQTQATVTIPGYKTDPKTKKKVSGSSASVPIIALETGASSNTTGTTFSVSSFSGTKRKQLYARSTGALTGGEAGMMHTVTDAERPQIIETLKTQLSERLRRETRAQIPEQLVTYPDLQFISIDINTLKLTGEGVKFTAKMSGSMTSYLIPKTLLEQAIAKNALSDMSYASVMIPELESLLITPESAIPASADKAPDMISIAISGEGKIIAQVSPEKVRSLLVGMKRVGFAELISSIPEIQSARYNIYPFWAPLFPKQEKYIYVDFK